MLKNISSIPPLKPICHSFLQALSITGFPDFVVTFCRINKLAFGILGSFSLFFDVRNILVWAKPKIVQILSLVEN